MATYIQGDIHEVIPTLEDNSIDLIYTDPPFGTTRAKWDIPLDWDFLFPEMWRVLKPQGKIILYASAPFTYLLLKYEKPKYHYAWHKNNSTNFFMAKQQPLRCMEEIFVYYKEPGTYNPQMTGVEKIKQRMISHKGQQYYGEHEKQVTEGKGHIGKYPTTYKNWQVRRDESGITRTDEQIDYFVKTYTNQGDVVLDMTCHNHYVGDRCLLLDRHYIGIDKELSYC
jgi:DNA modification methylase